MAGDRPRYELHFHGLVQASVVGDDNAVRKTFQDSLVRPLALPVHQLPPALADFTGRQEAIESLTTQLRQTGETAKGFAIVTGMAGVGKSTLAIQVAHQLKQDFPDAQLYVNLRGTESKPLEPFEVVTSFLRGLGVDDQAMPEDLRDRSALYRSHLSSKRAFILLDNARDEAQIRPLLPDSPSCAVLVTTRGHLTNLEGATVLDLAVMTDTEALELLGKLVGERTQTELEATKTIINLCNRLPLALRITGGTLKTKPLWRLNDYASLLASERQRLVQRHLSDLDVRATLALSYQSLDATSARLFRLLGLLTGLNFASALTTALLKSEPAIAEESLRCLVDKQLLEPANAGRYRLHELVRLFARGQLAQEELAEARQAARLRVSRWYLETSQVIGLALNSETRRQIAKVLLGGKSQSLEATEQSLLLVALNWFELERTNLLASIDWAYQAKAWEIVVPLARNLVNFFNTHAYWLDWEQTHLVALEAIRSLGDSPDDNHLDSRLQEAQTLINLGNVHSLQSNWGKASECYKQSLNSFQELEDRPGVARTLGNLGNVYSRQDYWGKASECYQQSLEIFRELKDRYGEAQTLANMGILSMQQSDRNKAIVLWQEALAKLPSDLPKAKRVAEWLQSVKGLEAPQPITTERLQNLDNPPAQPFIFVVLGGLSLVIAIALFFVFLM